MSVPRDSILIFLPQAHVGCEMCEATLKAKLARAGRNFIVENNSRQLYIIAHDARTDFLNSKLIIIAKIY